MTRLFSNMTIMTCQFASIQYPLSRRQSSNHFTFISTDSNRQRFSLSLRVVQDRDVGETLQDEETNLNSGGGSRGIVLVNPKPQRGLVAKAIDLLEETIVKFMYDSSRPLHYLSGNFAPVTYESPPTTNLPVSGRLPVAYFINSVYIRFHICKILEFNFNVYVPFRSA